MPLRIAHVLDLADSEVDLHHMIDLTQTEFSSSWLSCCFVIDSIWYSDCFACVGGCCFREAYAN